MKKKMEKKMKSKLKAEKGGGGEKEKKDVEQYSMYSKRWRSEGQRKKAMEREEERWMQNLMKDSMNTSRSRSRSRGRRSKKFIVFRFDHSPTILLLLLLLVKTHHMCADALCVQTPDKSM